MSIDIAEVKWDDEQSITEPKDLKLDDIKWDDKEVATPKTTTPAPAPSAPDESKAKTPKEKSLWERAKEGAKEAWNMIAPGVDNVVNVVSPIEIEVDKGGNNIRTKMDEAVTPDDVSFKVYKKIGALSKTASGLGEAKQEDIDTYNQNLGRLLVEDMGFDDFGMDEHGKYYVTKDGKDIELGKSSVKSIIADTLGDAGELAGGIIGAKKGYDMGKSLGWKGKVGGSILGGAIGASGGNAYDQLVSAVETGEKLTAAQRLKEMTKAAELNIAADIGGQALVKSAGVVAKPFKKAYELAKRKKLPERLADQFAKSVSDLPEREQAETLDALLYAKDSGIDLTSSSVVQNPQVDQFVQVVARNPFVRKAIKGTEAKNRDKLVENIYKIIDEKGAKATPEELDALLKQELGDAKAIRRAETDDAYEAFRASDTGAYKAKKDGLLTDLETRAKEWGYREKDPDSGELINPDLDKQVNRIKKYINYHAKKDGYLSASDLDTINSKLYKMADTASDPATRKMIYETRDQISDHIGVLAEKSGDDVVQKLRKAKTRYKEKENIYGVSSKHPDIKRALESHQANEEIHKLLTGANALDNANILKQELSRTKHGTELLGALGRKHIDDALADVDLGSASALSKAIGGDNIEVAKRLLGDKAGAQLGHIQKLLSMMGKTETLLKGAGAPINNGPSKSGIVEDAWNAVKKYTAYYAEHRYMSKVLTSTVAQKAYTKALQKAVRASSKEDIKSINSLLRTSAKATAKEYKVNMDDIVDMQSSRREEALAKRQARKKEVLAKREALKEKRDLAKSVKDFTLPDTHEIQAVERLYKGDNKHQSFASHTIRNIKEGNPTEVDIKKYLQAKKSIDADALASLQNKLQKESQEQAIMIGEKAELKELQKNIDTLDDEGIKRLSALDEKFNGKMFGAGGVAAIGASQADLDAEENRSAYIGKQEINMDNNEVLKDGKLTKDELVSLIEHAPEFEKQLATFGDVESEGKQKVMDRMLSMFNDEDPVTALAMVAENFYGGDDKKFMTAINDKKIESVSDAWVRDILDSDTNRKRVPTPVSDDYFSDIIKGVFVSEGGYVNDPDDLGGETRYGISKRAFPNEDIKHLSKERATELYRQLWEKKGYDKLENKAVAAQMFDMGINAGDSRAIKMAQRLLGVKADGVMGPVTLAALNDAGDEFVDAYKGARADYYRRISKYRNNKKYPDIKRALESHQANEEIHKLLTGANALDNANILKQELSRTKHGTELLGALGRKHIDDALADVDLGSASALSKAIGGDNIEVAKRLLGDKAGAQLGHIQKLLSMMGKTETLLKGAGAPINNGPSKSGIVEDAWNAVKKYTAYYAEHRYMSKVLTSTVAQKAYTKALQKAVRASSKEDIKSINSLLRTSAKATAKEYKVNMDDIVDMQSSRREEALAKRQARKKEVLAKREALKEKRDLAKSVKDFTLPDTHEIQAVERLYKGDNKHQSFASHTIRNIKEGNPTEVDIKKYLQAKKSIDADALASLQNKLQKESQEQAIMIGEKAELKELQKNIDTLDDEGIKRLSALDEKFNGKMFGAGGVAAIGASQADLDAEENRSAYIGKQEINMDNNEVLKDGKLTKDELVSLIEHAPEFEKQLATFGDVESEGKQKVMDRMLSMFNDEDPVTALAMVAENFYGGDDKKFMTAINDKKIESVSDAWVRDILDSDTNRKRVPTPVSDDYFSDIIKGVFVSEGGYVNDPDDLGGETRYGISKRAFPNEDIKHLSKERATELYRQLWEKKGYDKLENKAVAAQMFDMGINAGDSRAIKMAQRLLGVKADGVMGPVTLAALNDAGDEFVDAYKGARADYYRRISKYRNNKKYLNGWLKRIERV